MQSPTSVRGSCKDPFATFASIGLVTASAGFGAVYAWTTSSTHGVLLAGLAVLMAVSLEVAKPLAVSGMLDAVRRWEIGRASLLALLALIAIAYSVTAELSLMARSRADTTAERVSEARKGVDARARAETIRTEIGRHDTNASPLPPVAPSAPACSGEWLVNARARAACLEQSRLHSKAMETHADLVKQHGEQVAVRATERRTLVERLERAETDAGRAPVEKPADPGARALASYLAALGVSASPDKLVDWIVLVGVLALEIGSALAGLLATPVRAQTMGCDLQPVLAGGPRPGQAPDHSRAMPRPAGQGELDSARRRVLEIITAAGGTVHGGQRGLAERAGVSQDAAEAGFGRIGGRGRRAGPGGQYGDCGAANNCLVGGSRTGVRH